MNIVEAINKRKSIRKFRPDPVSRDMLAEIIKAGCQAPSVMNTQPWEFIVVSGDVLNKLRSAVVDKLNRKDPMEPEHHVVGYPNDSIYRSRQVELAMKLFKLMDIPREDKAKRAAWLERGFRYFDGPAAIFVLADRSLGESAPLLDLGAAMQNICLAALEYGLGTCIEDQGVLYPKVIREIIRIPENKKIISCIAIGYPDWEFPANAIVSGREPLDVNTRWIGF